MPDFGQNTITNRQAVLDIIDNSITEAVNTTKDFIYLVTQTATEQASLSIPEDDYVPFYSQSSNGISLNIDTITIAKNGTYKFIFTSTTISQSALLLEINGNIVDGFGLFSATYVYVPYIQQLSAGDEVKIIYKDLESTSDLGIPVFTVGLAPTYFLPGFSVIIEQL